jgi:hypothetical protein
MSKKDIQMSKAEDELLACNIPKLPEGEIGSPYLATAGVPNEWNDAVMNALFDDRCMNSDAAKRFMISGDLLWKSMHALVYLVRTRKTTECYNTQDALSDIDESLIPGENCKWLVKFQYETILECIARSTGDKLVNILNTDISLRFKRSKRDPNTTITTSPGARSFCFVGFRGETGQTVWKWVDIGYSDDLPQLTMLMPTPHYKGPRCHTNECQVFSALLRCTRCKAVYYCSRAHQKDDWPQHKLVCMTQ